MRRLLVPAALLAALIVAFLVLGPEWRGHADPKRATSTAREEVPKARSADAAVPGAGAATSDGAESVEAPARVRGVVTGTMGILWDARVVAYRAGSDEIIGRTWTDPKGCYTLEVEPDVTFDLSIEPAPETGLLPTCVPSLLLGPGDERTEDLALDAEASLRGRLVDPDGRPCGAVDLLALRPEDLGGPDISPAALAPLAAARIRSTDKGVFGFRGLEPGTYVLVVSDPDWMLPAPFSARADGPELTLVILPALTVDLRVRNVEGDAPVEVFSVTVRNGDRVILEDAGRAGVFSRRMPFPGQRDRTSMVFCDVTAPGFLPADALANRTLREHGIWLVPRRDPNTTVRISFDDREPYLGDLFVRFKAKAGASGTGQLRFEPVRDGVYRGGLPWGDWELALNPVGLFGAERFPAEAQIGANREAEVALVLPAGGTLVISPPADVERALAWIRTAAEAERGGTGRSFFVPREGTRIQGIPPGPYQLGYDREGRFVRDTVWFRDVRVVVSGTEDVTLPAE